MVNEGECGLTMKPDKLQIKGAKKDSKIGVGRSMTVHNLLFYAHSLCISYKIKAFLFVSSWVCSNYKQLLCFVQAQGQKTEQKHTTKNFVEFITISSINYVFKK